ncbi:MAG: hypothetical protein FJ135_14270 [Deltaproteobacteria bacterium]|nr:hypothetical protein [Deltaproteobacteria bacterium]
MKNVVGKAFVGMILLAMGFALGTLTIKNSYASKKIEYKVISLNPTSNNENTLNKLGAEGWEYIDNIQGVFAVFKR